MDLSTDLSDPGSSLQDLRGKLFPERFALDRRPTITEPRYGAGTLLGDWFERRSSPTVLADDWRTIHRTDFRFRVNTDLEGSRAARWRQLFVMEGEPGERLLAQEKAYLENKTTSYDLSYNVLVKTANARPPLRSYNAMKRKWMPEQDLTRSYGNLTNFGLTEALRNEWHDSSMNVEPRCWRTTYHQEIGAVATTATTTLGPGAK